MTGRCRALAMWCVLCAALLPFRAHAQDADAGVPSDTSTAPPDAGPVGPTRTPPRLIEAPEIAVPEGTEPLAPGSGVDLVLTIDATGTVTEAVIGTPLREDLDTLVLASAPLMLFEPATRDGMPVVSRVHFRYAVSIAAPIEEEPASESESESAAPAVPVEEPELADDEVATYSATGIADRPEPGAATRITLTGAELTTVPGTFGDPVRVLQFMPGVARLPYGIPLLVVRGAGLNNTGYFIDGFPVPNLWHFFLGPTVINTTFVTRQDFYPGNYPVRWGNFSGGVVSLETSAPAGPMHFDLQVDALRAEAFASIPFDHNRGNFSFAARRSYFELLLPIISQVSGQALPSVSYDDYQARLEYRFDDHFSASLFVFGSDDSLDSTTADGSGTTSANSQTSLSYSFQRVIGRLDWHVGETTTVRLSGSVGRDVTGFGSRQAGTAAQVFAFENFIGALRIDVATAIAPWLRTNFGVDASGTSFGVNVTAPVPLGLGQYDRPLFDPQLVAIQSRVGLSSPGIYGEAILDFQPVEISIGTRLEILRYGQYFDLAPDPRTVVRVHASPDVTLTASTGLFTQPPQIYQTIAIAGDPRLSPQRAWQSSAQVEANLPFGIYARVTGYFSYMWNIARLNVMNSDGTTRRQAFTADQEGRSYGMEVLVRRPLGDGFYGWLSYTLSRSERIDPGGQWFTFGFDQTHILNLAASYEFDGWRFGASFQVTTGRPRMSICATIFDAESGSYAPTVCDRGERAPTYTQLNVRIDREFNIDNALTGSVYIDVLNVLYTANTEGLIYQYDYTRSIPLPGIPLLGTIGIRGSWEPH